MAEPGALRPIPDPEAEIARLALQRQILAGQVCPEADRACDPDCEIGPPHCAMHHQARKAHDATHCDRVWAEASARG